MVPALLALVSGIAAAEVTATFYRYDFKIAHRPGYPADGIGIDRYKTAVCQALGYDGHRGVGVPHDVSGSIATRAFIDEDGLWQHTREAQRAYTELSCFNAQNVAPPPGIAHRPGFPVDGFGTDKYLNAVCKAALFERHDGLTLPQKVVESVSSLPFVDENGRWQKTDAAEYVYPEVNCFKPFPVTHYSVSIAHRPGYPADGFGISKYLKAVCQELGFEGTRGFDDLVVVPAGDAPRAFLNEAGQWEVTREAEREYTGITCFRM